MSVIFLFFMIDNASYILGLGGCAVSLVDDPFALYYNPGAVVFLENREFVVSTYMATMRGKFKVDFNPLSLSNMLYSQGGKEWGGGVGFFESGGEPGFLFSLSYRRGVAGFGLSLGKSGDRVLFNPGVMLKDVEFIQIPGLLNFGLVFLSPDRMLQFAISYRYDWFTFTTGTQIKGTYPGFLASLLFSFPFWRFKELNIGAGWNDGDIGLLMTCDLGDAEFMFSTFNFDEINISLLLRIGSRESISEEIARINKEKEEREKLTSRTYLSQGISFYNDGKYEEAIQSFDIALVWDPDNKEAEEWKRRAEKEFKDRVVEDNLIMAEEAMIRKDYPEVMRYCEEVLKIDSTNSRALSLYSEAERKFKDYLFESFSSKSYGDYIQKMFKKGTHYYARGDYLKAKEIFERILQVDKKNSLAKEYLSKTKERIAEKVASGLKKLNYYERKGRYVDAYNLALSLKRMAPNNKEINSRIKRYRRKISQLAKEYCDKGIAAYDVGNYVLAQKYFRNLLSLDPDNKTAKKYLELIKNRISRKDADRLYMLGLEAYTNHDYDKALYYWRQVESVYPDYPNLKKNIRRAEEKLKIVRESSE